MVALSSEIASRRHDLADRIMLIPLFGVILCLSASSNRRSGMGLSILPFENNPINFFPTTADEIPYIMV
jgi:hypothetical protein